MTKRLPLLGLCAILLASNAVGADPPRQSSSEIVQQLETTQGQVRLQAEAKLIDLGSEAVDALVKASCGEENPSQKTVGSTLRILKQWEKRSWTDPASEAAIDKFIELVRDPANCAREHLPLSPEAKYPFAEAVRMLDIDPDEAAAYLRQKKGVKVHESSGAHNDSITSYTRIILSRDWIPDPKDWLYIANLTRDIDGKGVSYDIYIGVIGSVEGDMLAECFKYFRKSKNSPFDIDIPTARINRKALLVLGSYSGLKGLAVSRSAGDITDEVWAQCIGRWPNAVQLILSPAAGQKSIAALSKLESLAILYFLNKELTATDLAPFRNHKKLEVLWGRSNEPSGQIIEYINQQGTGLWQLDDQDQPE